MRRRFREILIIGGLFAALGACGQEQSQTPNSPIGYGPNPALPEPSRTLIPTVKVSEVVGWPQGVTPSAPAGF